nr:transmembrane protein 53-like [Lytechinus pictus]
MRQCEWSLRRQLRIIGAELGVNLENKYRTQSGGGATGWREGMKGPRARLSSSSSDVFDVLGDIDSFSLLELNTTVISDNLELKTNDDLLHDESLFESDLDFGSTSSSFDDETYGHPSERPLVVMFSWLLAKPRHVSKYVELYTRKGMDVLVVKTRPIDIAWPANAKEIAREILDYVTDGDKRPLLIHAFSVSSHVYAEMLDLVDAVEKYSSVRYRIVGQVLDSCVLSRDSYEGIYSQASTNSFTQLFIKRVAETYFWVTNKYTMDSIIKVNEIFTGRPVKAPALILFSRDDHIATAKENDELVDQWRKHLDDDLYVKCWQSSPHVGHLVKHRDEYEDSIYGFVGKLKGLPRKLHLERPIPPTSAATLPQEAPKEAGLKKDE